MQQELARAQTIAHRQRLRLTLSAITIGTLLCLLGGILYIGRDDKLWGRVWAVPVLAGAFVAGLAVLPTDTRAIRVLSWISVLFWASALIAYFTQTWKALRSQNHVEATSKTAIGVCMLIYRLSGVSILCQRSLPARVAHARIWRNLRAFIGGTAAVYLIIYPILAIAAMPDDPTSLHILGVELCEALLYLLGVAASTPSRRRRAQEYMTLVGTRGEIRQAALVAKLIGGLSASEVVALARKYFRGLSFDVLLGLISTGAPTQASSRRAPNSNSAVATHSYLTAGMTILTQSGKFSSNGPQPSEMLMAGCLLCGSTKVQSTSRTFQRILLASQFTWPVARPCSCSLDQAMDLVCGAS